MEDRVIGTSSGHATKWSARLTWNSHVAWIRVGCSLLNVLKRKTFRLCLTRSKICRPYRTFVCVSIIYCSKLM